MRKHCAALIGFALTLALLVTAPAWGVVVYDQPSNFPGGASFTSDHDPITKTTIATVYDNFTFAQTTTITDVHWQGDYLLDPPISSFTLGFYVNNVLNQPGPALAVQTFAGNANETLVDAGQQVYNYSVDLTTPFVAAAGTTYWLSILATLDTQAGATEWAWHAGTGGDSHAVQDTFFGRSNLPNDMAFSLTAAQAPGTTGTPEPLTLTTVAMAAAALGVVLRRRSGRPRIALCLVPVVALVLVVWQPATVNAALVANAYTEVGDAGNTLNNPQAITGGPYDAIIGFITDSTDVYSFHWVGGDFRAQYFAGADPTISLFDAEQNPLGTNTGLNPVLSIPDVPEGNYLFAISDLVLPVAPAGPQAPLGAFAAYVVTFQVINNPNIPLTIAAPTAAPTAVPEPVTAATVALAAAALTMALRRRVHI